ncbi:MAG: glycosyltransferase family 39 protein [Chloroflexi bacterium]|nr:glycosyltransferase family 39 protein [Chloroflexota bacterium]
MNAIGISGLGASNESNDLASATVRKFSLPWRRLALGTILLLAAFLNFYQIGQEGYANSYYAAAVRSMSLSWHNFFFAAFDPSGFVTIDKPPLGFWFQVASVKLFGFNGVSLMLPEGLAGILSVALLYHLVKRVFGVASGLLAALFMAITPVAVADNRNNTIDSILVLFMLLGAWAIMRAVEQRRGESSLWSGFRWLLLCALIVGLGFNVKMLEAFLVVPAFGLAYLLGAQVRIRTRIVPLVLAGLVMLTVSLSWAVAVDMTPASQRPWVDSTTTNSEIDLAIGYNGLQRLLGHSGTPAAASPASAAAKNPTTSTPGANSTGATNSAPANAQGPRGQGNPGGGGGLFNNGAAGPLRLIDSQLGGQAGWLLPLAVVGLLAASSRRLRFPLDSRQKGLVLWGGWLVTMAGFYSVAGFFHSYYLVTIAPAIAALAGIGLVAIWQDYLQHRSLTSWRGWLLPAALLATAISQVHILSGYPAWSSWMAPLVLACTIVPAVALVAARLRPRRRLPMWTPVALAIGSVALLVAPTVWAADTVRSVGGSIPSAGPSVQAGNGAGGFPGGAKGNPRFGQPPSGGFPGRGQGNSPFGQRSGGALSGQMPPGGGGPRSNVNTQLLSYLLKNQGATNYLVVTTNSNSAAPYIIKTGKPVMSLGGFGGNDPIVTLAQFKTLVKSNTVRYVLAGGGGGGMDGGSAVMQWVQTACAAVPASNYQTATSSSSTSANAATDNFGGAALYDCRGA